jgi:cytochrome c-type biogenesis protein CcmH/NrfG
MNDNSGKRRLWIYACILFTCIFLILLISAYSQRKFDTNIESYRLKLSEQENQKLESEINLKTAMDEIKKLKEGATESKSQTEAAKKQLEEEKKKSAELEQQLKDKLKTMKNLSRLTNL